MPFVRSKLPLLLAVACLAALASPAHAGFGDALKKKYEEQKKKAAAEAAKAAGQAGTPSPGATPETPTGERAPGKASPDAGPKASAGEEKVSEVSTKFDFVPGDHVLVLDDFTQDDLGEFPARWKAVIGTFEVAESAGERWLRCMSPDGTVRLRLPEGPLPEYWTLEFDFFGTEPLQSALNVRGMSKQDDLIWEASWPQGTNLSFRSGDFYSTTPLEGARDGGGRHHFMLMARGRGLKLYLDRQRLVNLPEVSDAHGPVVALDFRLWAQTRPMITAVRFAEGCKPAADLLAQGHLVTYGIRFATGSDVVLPESAPVLRQVAAWLTANPAAKLSITGHTDNVGGASANLDLSKRRAASVARVLGEQFSVAADRLSTDGKGDTQPLAANDKPEGRAMNRRVEFAKR